MRNKKMINIKTTRKQRQKQRGGAPLIFRVFSFSAPTKEKRGGVYPHLQKRSFLRR